MITRDYILQEIKRTAESNGGLPLGARLFERETAIKPYDWGRYWARFGDAVNEAGFEPNAKHSAIPDDEILTALALLARELQKRPTSREMQLKKRSDPAFPGLDAISRLGNINEITRRLSEFCRSHSDFSDLSPLLPVPEESKENIPPDEVGAVDGQRFGYVYMLKFRRNDFKIGASNDPERRYGEIETKMPEPPVRIHTIQTDDPFGVEAYWHRRFADKRRDKSSEWFQLTAADVRAFRRWKKLF